LVTKNEGKACPAEEVTTTNENIIETEVAVGAEAEIGLLGRKCIIKGRPVGKIPLKTLVSFSFSNSNQFSNQPQLNIFLYFFQYQSLQINTK